MEKIRIVILDCDNCTWFHKKEEPEIIAREMGITELEEFQIEYYNFFGSFMHYFKDRKVTINETYRLLENKMPILQIYNYTPTQFMKISEKLKFLGNNLNSDAIELVKYLSDKGIKIIVLSDWWREIQEDMLKKYGLLDYIEEIHCFNNQYLKCNPLSAKGLIKSGKEDQYVIIGDSLMSDIAFATHSGIRSIWFNNKREKENNTRFKPTFEVTSLLEVMKIV